MSLTEITGILFQHMWQKAENEKRRGDLIGFRCPKSLRVGAPSLSIVRLPVTRLLEPGLKQISDMGAEIDGLVNRQNVFFFWSERLLVFWDIVLGLKIGDEAENTFGILVMFNTGSWRLGAGTRGRVLRSLLLLR